jgi:hypothetical protein
VHATPQIDLSEDVFPEASAAEAGLEPPAEGEPEVEPERTDESIAADQVAPEEQGPGDSEGEAPAPPPEAEAQQTEQ